MQVFFVALSTAKKQKDTLRNYLQSVPFRFLIQGIFVGGKGCLLARHCLAA